jgi:hypothetical protein
MHMGSLKPQPLVTQLNRMDRKECQNALEAHLGIPGTVGKFTLQKD